MHRERERGIREGLAIAATVLDAMVGAARKREPGSASGGKAAGALADGYAEAAALIRAIDLAPLDAVEAAD